MQQIDVTREQILDEAQVNATGFALGAIVCLKQHGLPVEAFPALLGRAFAPEWDHLPAHELPAVARQVALEAVSVGATVQALTADETQAEVVVTSWPPQEALTAFGVSQTEADVIWQTLDPIATHLGLRFAMCRDGEHLRLQFSR